MDPSPSDDDGDEESLDVNGIHFQMTDKNFFLHKLKCTNDTVERCDMEIMMNGLSESLKMMNLLSCPWCPENSRVRREPRDVMAVEVEKKTMTHQQLRLSLII